MKRISYKLLSLVICCLLFGNLSAAAFSGLDYADVPQGHWAYKDVTAMTDAGIVNGVGERQYKPLSEVTYAMMITVIGRCALEDQVVHVDGEQWYAPYVRVLDELDILDDMDFTMDALHDPVNRYDMARVINGCLRYLETDLSPYDTGEIMDYHQIPAEYQEDVLGVFAAGIITGYADHCFHGEKMMNRAQLAAVANRFHTLLKEAPALYRLTIETTEGGTVPAGMETEINGFYPAGARVGLIVKPMPGYVFAGWNSSNGGWFEHAAAQSVFVMPESDTVITATFDPE